MQKNNIEDIIIRAKQHDQEAFTNLMQMHMKDMYKVGYAILMNDEDVADAIQDTILACWEKLETLKQNKYFKTWMTRILINNCYVILRRRKCMTNIEELNEEPYYYEQDNLELKEALNCLDEKYRAVIVLYYCHEFSVKEIGKILELNKSTVTTRLQRGREQLAKYYGREF